MARRPVVNSQRVLFAIVAEGFLSRLSFGVINVALPLYMHRELGMSVAQIGFVISLNTIVAMLFKPVMGSLADRFGLKRSLSVSVTLRSAVTLLLAAASTPLQIYAARSVHGLSVALRDPVVGALIAEHGGKKRIAQTFAWYQTAKSAAGNLGKAMAPTLLLASGENFTFVYLVAFAMSMLPIVVVLRYVRDPPPFSAVSAVGVAAAEAKEKKAAEAGATGVPKSAIASFMGLGFFVSATANMLSGLFPLIVTDYAGLSDGVLSIAYIIGTAAAFTGPVFGWLSDNVGNKIVLSLRSAANVFSSVLYIVAPTVVGVFVGKALDDMGKAAFKPGVGRDDGPRLRHGQTPARAHVRAHDHGGGRGRDRGADRRRRDGDRLGLPRHARRPDRAGGRDGDLHRRHQPPLPAARGRGEEDAQVAAGGPVARGGGDLRRFRHGLRRGQRAGPRGHQGHPRAGRPRVAQEGEPAKGKDGCTGDPTVDAIRRSTGGC